MFNTCVQVEPVKIWVLQRPGISYYRIESASPTFSTGLLHGYANGITKVMYLNNLNKLLRIEYSPKRKTIGFDVKRQM
jgi:hypothetical protein